MNWKDEYNKKLVTAKEALENIKSNDRVVISHACGEPVYLTDRLVELEGVKNVEIVHMVAMGHAKYCQEKYKDNFRHNSLFVGGSTREAIKSGRGDFTPTFFYKVPDLFRTSLPVDVALIQVSKPDKNGYVSLGISVDYTKSSCEVAKIVIAQVNENMPKTFGDSFLHISDIDYIVEKNEPIIELPKAKIGEVEKEIGRYCASLINDGDTLQLGIGAIPDAVLTFLKDKKDLGIHSEMVADGVAELVKEGIITNKRKKLDPGKMVVTFSMGTRELYDFLDDNPSVMFMPVDYVNNPTVIMQEDNIVSINSCVQIDLMGQVASETIGETQISGTGGQVDFIRGASMAKNGRSIIAMPSTVKGKLSKIVTKLDDYSVVTTSRNDVDYVITEYGIAHLRGKTLRERSLALINIAHPDFRDELLEYHNKKFGDK